MTAVALRAEQVCQVNHSDWRLERLEDLPGISTAGIHRHPLGRSNQQLVLQVQKARALGMEPYVYLPLDGRSCDSNVSTEDRLHDNARYRKTRERKSQPVEQGASPNTSECFRTKRCTIIIRLPTHTDSRTTTVYRFCWTLGPLAQW